MIIFWGGNVKCSASLSDDDFLFNGNDLQITTINLDHGDIYFLFDNDIYDDSINYTLHINNITVPLVDTVYNKRVLTASYNIPTLYAGNTVYLRLSYSSVVTPKTAGTLTIIGSSGTSDSVVSLGLGDRFVVRADDMVGNEVCEVTLDGIKLALLNESQNEIRDKNDCPQVIGNGTFFMRVGLINEDGNIHNDLITKLLNSDGVEELVIRDNTGFTLSTTVLVDPPTLTVEPNDYKVFPGDYLVFRGDNFPVEQVYSGTNSITVTIDETTKTIFNASDGRWEFKYRVPSDRKRRNNIHPLIKINDYSLIDLTSDVYIKVMPPMLDINPTEVKIGQPITVTAKGLDLFTQGYHIRIDNGPFLDFDGENRFATDGSGEFASTTTISEDFHRYYLEDRTHPIILRIKRKTGDESYYAATTVTLLPEVYDPPQSDIQPTITPEPIQNPKPIVNEPCLFFGLYMSSLSRSSYTCALR